VVRVTPKIPSAEPSSPSREAVVREGYLLEEEPPAGTFLHLHPARPAAALPVARAMRLTGSAASLALAAS